MARPKYESTFLSDLNSVKRLKRLEIAKQTLLNFTNEWKNTVTLLPNNGVNHYPSEGFSVNVRDSRVF